MAKKRGRTSNRAAPAELKTQALDLVRQKYADFGPTLAAEKLREVHSIYVGRETLRTWMLEAGVWSDRQKRRGRVYQPRYRRECVGELIQVDGSDHFWFEDRADSCTLLVFIDDATSRLMHLQFVQSESTFAYFNATQRYLEAHGKPIAFYTDKHAVFPREQARRSPWRPAKALGGAIRPTTCLGQAEPPSLKRPVSGGGPISAPDPLRTFRKE